MSKGADRISTATDNITSTNDSIFQYNATQTKAMRDSIFSMYSDVLPGTSVSKENWRLPSQATRYRWAIETNTLYWAMLRPNVGFEYAFANHWSAGLNFDIAWWQQQSEDRFYQLWTLSPEIRYWFNNYGSCSNFYIGAHFLTGSYDLKNGRVGYWNESLMETGLSAGYAMRMGRRSALRFGMGVGYLNTSYKKYTRYYPMGEHYIYDGTGRTTYWGITRAEVSLTWNLGKKR